MNFALMFALALGIDYALFLVVRFRAARFGATRTTAQAVAETMDTAGKAVLFSGLTVLISLSAVMLVPSPAFRSMALGIMLAVVFVLAATLTLLPAVLGKLGHRVDALALPWVHAGEHRSPRFAAVGASGCGVVRSSTALLALVAAGRAGRCRSWACAPACRASRSYPTRLQPRRLHRRPGRLRPRRPRHPAGRHTRGAGRPRRAGPAADPGIAAGHAGAAVADGRMALIQAVPTVDPSDAALGTTVDRLRTDLPAGALVGGAAAENHDLETAAVRQDTAGASASCSALGFLLLLVALQAPLVAALGVVTNLLAIGAAFGVARLVFQDGHGAGLLGFEPQGFLDAWAPVFFFAMIFAIAMDYTVFLLASAQGALGTQPRDAHEAMVGGLAHSGRVIFAAAGVMVAVFFTFALSGPLPPKEMGVVLGVAVLLDALLVRLLLLPVLLRLTGRAAWACPAWLRRILPNIRFSH